MLRPQALKISCKPEKVVWRRKTCRGGICARSWSQTWRVQPEEYLKRNLLLKVVVECNSFVPFVTRPFPHLHSWTSIRSSICKSKFHNCSHLDFSWQNIQQVLPLWRMPWSVWLEMAVWRAQSKQTWRPTGNKSMSWVPSDIFSENSALGSHANFP